MWLGHVKRPTCTLGKCIKYILAAWKCGEVKEERGAQEQLAWQRRTVGLLDRQLLSDVNGEELCQNRRWFICDLITGYKLEKKIRVSAAQ